MKNTGWIISIAAVVIITGCSGESIAEKVVENRIEAESGEDVDIDLSDGSFSIQTEDGDIEFNSDGDGNFSIEGIDGDGQDFSVNSEDGATVVESEDGTATFEMGTELPADFPEVPLPDDLRIQFTNVIDTGAGVMHMLVGVVPDDGSAYLDTITGYLESQGYTQQMITNTPDGSVFSYVKGTDAVTGSIGPDTSGISDGGATVTLQVQVGEAG